MHLGKLCFKCDKDGLPLCKACLMIILVKYWCAVVPEIFSLFLSVWFFSSRPCTPEGRARYSLPFLCRSLLFFVHSLPGLALGSNFALCSFTTCPCAFVCCSAPIVAAEKWEGLCVYRWGRVHGSMGFSSSHLHLSLSLYASVSPHHPFTQVSLYYISVDCSQFHS